MGLFGYALVNLLAQVQGEKWVMEASSGGVRSDVGVAQSSHPITLPSPSGLSLSHLHSTLLHSHHLTCSSKQGHWWWLGWKGSALPFRVPSSILTRMFLEHFLWQVLVLYGNHHFHNWTIKGRWALILSKSPYGQLVITDFIIQTIKKVCQC